jgi:hypothetical protein
MPMNNQILKLQWERYREHITLSHDTVQELIQPIISDAIQTIELMEEGCANTNYKVTFVTHDPVILRIYTRESSSITREVDLHHMLQDHVPVSKFIFADNSLTLIEYPFAICSYINGILLRNAILSGNEKAIRESCFDVGRHLATLSKITFENAGFFEEHLTVRPFKPEEEYFNYVMGILQDKNVGNDLGKQLLHQVRALIEQNHTTYLPKSHGGNMTHGDFDPANIKVAEIGGTWRVTGILDWEFSFAGSHFLDIGMMIRYSHKLPHYYEESFIRGIKKNGVALASHWKKSAKMMDLLCLLQLVHFNPKERRPQLNLDVRGLISHTIHYWETF